MKKVQIDVRDLDYTWWEKVEAYREGGKLHLPRESVERLGEIDLTTGDAHLIDGHVEAKANTISVEGTETPVWTLGLEQLVTRPSRQTGRGDRGRG